MGRLVAIVLVGLLAAGCGGGDDDSSPDTSRPPADVSSSAAPPTTRSAESEVEEAYLAYWAMADRLLEAPDPDDPEIARRSTDPARGQLVDSLTTLRSQDQVVRSGGDYRHDVLSVEVSVQTAVVRDCVIDDNAVVNATSGVTIDDRVTTVLLETTLRHDGTRWVVTTIDQKDGWEGATTCRQ